MIEKIKAIKPRVKQLLENYPYLRESDNKLIASIWNSEIRQRGIGATEFFRQFGNGRFTSPESIRRCRQKLQQDNPELRGQNRVFKMELAGEMKENINKI